MTDANPALTPEARRLAVAYGLGKLADCDPGAIAKAVAAATRLKDAMPRDFSLADEPAHVYRAGPEA